MLEGTSYRTECLRLVNFSERKKTVQTLRLWSDLNIYWIVVGAITERMFYLTIGESEGYGHKFTLLHGEMRGDFPSILVFKMRNLDFNEQYQGVAYTEVRRMKMLVTTLKYGKTWMHRLDEFLSVIKQIGAKSGCKVNQLKGVRIVVGLIRDDRFAEMEVASLDTDERS